MDSLRMLKLLCGLGCRGDLLCEHFDSRKMDPPRIELGSHPCHGCVRTNLPRAHHNNLAGKQRCFKKYSYLIRFREFELPISSNHLFTLEIPLTQTSEPVL